MTLLEVLYEMVHGKQQAKSIDQIVEDAYGVDPETEKPRKSKWSLYKELDPSYPGAKFAAADLLPLMRACGDIAPLRYIAAQMGYVLVPMTCAPDGRNLDHECLQALQAMARFVESIQLERTPYEDDIRLLELANKEGQDCIVRKRDRQEAEKAGRAGQ